MYIIWRQTADNNQSQIQQKEFLCGYDPRHNHWNWQGFRSATYDGEISIFDDLEDAWRALEDVRRLLREHSQQVWVTDIISCKTGDGMTQEQVEITLRRYFWRYVASSKGWKRPKEGIALFRFSRTENITVCPMPAEFTQEWIVGYERHLVGFEHSYCHLSIYIVVPVAIDIRLMNRLYIRK